jgi:proteasome lid subunit RPN8/RPN11
VKALALQSEGPRGSRPERPRPVSGKLVLRISQSDHDLIRREAERSYPHECCGILVGSASGERRAVSLVVPCDNTRSDAPERRYSIDPRQIIDAMKLGRSRGENIVGFYHSHPDHPARYSATDLAEAHWFDCSYVIVGVEQGRAGPTQSFLLAGSEDSKRFEPEEIQIRPANAPNAI